MDAIVISTFLVLGLTILGFLFNVQSGVKFLVKWHKEETALELTPFELRLLKDVLELKEGLQAVARQANANGVGLDANMEELSDLKLQSGILRATMIDILKEVNYNAELMYSKEAIAKKPRKKHIKDPKGQLAKMFPNATELNVQWNSESCVAELYYITSPTEDQDSQLVVLATLPWRKNKKGFRADNAWRKFANSLLEQK